MCVSIHKNQRITNSDLKMDLSLNIASNLLKCELITESELRDVKDVVVTVLYDYSLFKIESTEIVLSDEEEFEELCEFYITKKYIAGLCKESIDHTIDEVRKFHAFVNKRISEVTTEDIDMYLVQRQLKSNLKKTTLKGYKLNLSSFFALLYRNKRIVSNPMDGVEKIKEEIRYETPLTKTEITKLEECCKNYREKALITLMLETGVRVTECSNLNIKDIDFQKMELFVHRGKGRKDRVIPFGEKSLHLLRKYLTNERPDIDFVNNIVPDKTPLFTCDRKPYNRLKDTGIQSILKQLGTKTNILRIHPHLLRKTYATGLYKKGVPVNVIAKLLGHANLDCIPRYVVINDVDVKNVLNGSGVI